MLMVTSRGCQVGVSDGLPPFMRYLRSTVPASWMNFMVDFNELYASLVFGLGFRQASPVTHLHLPVPLHIPYPFVNSNHSIRHFRSSCAENVSSATVWELLFFVVLVSNACSYGCLWFLTVMEVRFRGLWERPLLRTIMVLFLCVFNWFFCMQMRFLLLG